MALPKISKMHKAVQEHGLRKAIDAEMNGEKLPRAVRRQKGMENNLWDQLERIYQVSMHGIGVSDQLLVDQLSTTLNDPELLARVGDPSALVALTTTLNTDLANHIARLNAIHDKHAGKSGSATFDRMDEVLAIFDEYTTAQEFYEGTISPNHRLILKQLNINVHTPSDDGVTDVVAREVTPNALTH